MAGKRPRRLTPVLWLALIFIVPAVIYLGYVLDKQPEVNEHRKNSLDHLARRLESALAGTIGNIANIAGGTPFRFGVNGELEAILFT